MPKTNTSGPCPKTKDGKLDMRYTTHPSVKRVHSEQSRAAVENFYSRPSRKKN